MKKIRNGLMSAVLAGALIAPVFAPAAVYADVDQVGEPVFKTHAEIFAGGADEYAGKTVILHSNDVHGALKGYAMIADLEDDFEAAGAEVIMVDCGDYTQGDPLVSISKGASAIELMNLAGYEYSTLGNHEFDFGIDVLKENLNNAAFTPVCADVLDTDGLLLEKDHVIHETKSGVKIGFFGMETPETQTKANPALIKGLTFLSNSAGKTELNDCAAIEVQELKEEGADIIVTLAHLGVDDESIGNQSYDVFNSTPGIDIMLDGHSHTEMTEGKNGEMIQSTGLKFANIGVVVIDDATKAIEDHYLVKTKTEEGEDALTSDEEVAAAEKKISDEVDALLGEVIGTSEVRFASQKTENRCYETNTGDLVTDAMMWTILNQTDSLLVDDDHVVAITNGGGLRAGLEEGSEVTMKDINTILPFGNTLTLAYIDGATLLEALEASTFCTPKDIGGFPQTKGIQFTIDASKPYDKGELYPDSTYYAPKSIQRVSIQSINGKPFNENDIYALITNNFISAGGDTYYAVSAADTSFDTGIPLDEAVSGYIANALDGKLTKEMYGEPRGDITIGNAPVAAPVALSKVSGGKKKITVKFKPEDSTLAVQISYSMDENFEDDTTATVNVEAGKTKATIKKLKSKKKYYVRVRSVITVGETSFYSAWSDAKKVKVK
ncbi:MAG: bifunctional metallophosphatase/5'-nucleotidase [Lachnospiraceae bacterium]|nr:bifunctional metallophosphatase/5'-nucleotidase [Lachnospiraceae bacterium]